MSTGALFIARFSNPEGFLPAAALLEHSEVVECWNAVDGHIDLVAKVNSPASALLAQLRNLAGIAETHTLDLFDETGKLACDPASSNSFVFLEVEAEKKSIVREKLRTLESVAYCSSIQDTNDLVVIVSGKSFQAIDRTVNEQIRTIDGVRRVKQDRVLHLKQL